MIARIMNSYSRTRIKTLLEDVIGGYRISVDEADLLYKAADTHLHQILDAADQIRQERCGQVVTYVKNQNINCSNLCVNSCGFCGFCRKPSDPDAYTLNKEDIIDKVKKATERGVTEICTVSGLHPDFTCNSYLDIYRTIHSYAPDIHIHASNPMEVAYAAQKSCMTTKEVLEKFKSAGLKTLCGTAAEILSDPVREIICPDKIKTEEWIRIIKEAHKCRISSTATIMYGSCETVRDRNRHLQILRDIQDETGGFTEFVPLSYVHTSTPLYKEGKSMPGATGRQDLLMVAIGRIFLDNFRNIQVSWVKLGPKMAQLGLLCGGNDLGGTLYEESISKKAGSLHGEWMDPVEMEYICDDINRPLRERYTDYSMVNMI